jgi:hypothetical protein
MIDQLTHWKHSSVFSQAKTSKDFEVATTVHKQRTALYKIIIYSSNKIHDNQEAQGTRDENQAKSGNERKTEQDSHPTLQSAREEIKRQDKGKEGGESKANVNYIGFNWMRFDSNWNSTLPNQTMTVPANALDFDPSYNTNGGLTYDRMDSRDADMVPQPSMAIVVILIALLVLLCLILGLLLVIIPPLLATLQGKLPVSKIRIS